MKKIALILAIVAAMAAPAFAGTLDDIIGVNLGNAQVSSSVIRADGTLSVTYKGTVYDGTWHENAEGQYCRIISAFNVDGCQVVVFNYEDDNLVWVEFRDPGADSGNRYNVLE